MRRTAGRVLAYVTLFLIAVVALARKIAGIMFAIWRDGSVYRPNVRQVAS